MRSSRYRTSSNRQTFFGPLTVVHDHATGRSKVESAFDLHVVLRASRRLTVREAAEQMFGTDDPTRNQVERARRKLEALRVSGGAEIEERSRESGGKPEKVYVLSEALS